MNRVNSKTFLFTHLKKNKEPHLSVIHTRFTESRVLIKKRSGRGGEREEKTREFIKTHATSFSSQTHTTRKKNVRVYSRSYHHAPRASRISNCLGGGGRTYELHVSCIPCRAGAEPGDRGNRVRRGAAMEKSIHVALENLSFFAPPLSPSLSLYREI